MIATGGVAPRSSAERAGVVGQDRDGAARDRVADEAAAVGARAGQRGEQKAGLDLARIGGEAADLGIAAARR